MPLSYSVRSLKPTVANLRIDRRDAANPQITGYAAPFYQENDAGTEYRMHNGVERIMPGAFTDALAGGNDIAAFFNHNDDILLGRRSAGTLHLEQDSFGLRFAIPYDADDPDHQRIARKIDKGELNGASFGFEKPEVEWSREGDQRVRNLTKIPLIEVSVVVWPAYKATTAGVRNAERSDFAAALAEQLERETNYRAARAKLTKLDI